MLWEELPLTLTFEQLGFAPVGPLIHGFFKNTLETFLDIRNNLKKLADKPYDFLSNIFFPLAYFSIIIQYIRHITYKMCINRLFEISVRLPVNSRS